MMHGDGHAVGAADVGVVRHAHFVEAGPRQVRREGGALLPLLFLHVMNVAHADEGRGVHAVFPFADEFGFRVVYHGAGQLGFVRHDELDVLRFINLIRPR